MTYDPAGRAGHKCYLQVVAWEKFQHYKDRNPPWIKFYSSLLEDPGMAALPDSSKAHLFGIWLLASRLGNRIPFDADFIGKRINATTPVDIKSLILFGFLEPLAECLQHASNPLATCATTFPARTQSRDRVETERETEQIAPRTDAPRSPAWSSEACDDWNAVFGAGSAHGGKVGKALKTLVDRHTWLLVRPAWQFYLRAPDDAKYKSPAAFAEKYAYWAAGAPVESRAPPPKETVADRSRRILGLPPLGGLGDIGNRAAMGTSQSLRRLQPGAESGHERPVLDDPQRVERRAVPDGDSQRDSD